MFGWLKKKEPEEEYRSGLNGGAGAFRMTVEDVFTVSGRGTVVVGKVEEGTVSVGDEVVICRRSGCQPARVDGLERFREVVKSARAGEAVGVLLRKVSHDQVERGDILRKK